MANQNDIETLFTKSLSLFIKSTKDSMEHANTCAIMALEHFEEHGQVAYIERFYNACAKNYVRREAFVKWAMEYSPLMKDANGVWCKNPSENAQPFNVNGLDVEQKDGTIVHVKGASEIKFWEFAPDKEITYMGGADDVVVEFKKVVKRLENRNRYNLGKKAEDKLRAVKQALDASPATEEDEERPAKQQA